MKNFNNIVNLIGVLLSVTLVILALWLIWSPSDVIDQLIMTNLLLFLVTFIFTKAKK